MIKKTSVLISAAVLLLANFAFADLNGPGRCLARETNNPGYEAFCGRFDGWNSQMCEQVSQFCFWQPSAAQSRPDGYCWPNCPVSLQAEKAVTDSLPAH